ncbi:Lrp/AsnC ligand binding domain-containing protein [Leeia sp. TBRC 13508]|uniref:Lrp/AsnC ligand binding domain-containing protein n=1 Tax=Leeia speluncae TaxID=2884804 RepID=A0ABS8D2U9_9NEIS|nr:Lrp/AsnC ligand binding domain-containing protein [Leeia speluncae]MCB6182527.1 Lrp/AsnC ligand binding domain-containing protein [Leeia speluncae]
MITLDRTDKAILKFLQDDGKMTNVELAKQVHLSPAACLERVKRLQFHGYIRHYMAVLDPNLMGVGLLVFVEVSLDRTTPESFASFKDAAKKMPQIMECHMVAGGFDYLIKARVKDMNAYRTFLDELLSSVKGVRETHTYAVMEEVKNTVKLPI